MKIINSFKRWSAAPGLSIQHDFFVVSYSQQVGKCLQEKITFTLLVVILVIDVFINFVEKKILCL